MTQGCRLTKAEHQRPGDSRHRERVVLTGRFDRPLNTHEFNEIADAVKARTPNLTVLPGVEGRSVYIDAPTEENIEVIVWNLRTAVEQLDDLLRARRKRHDAPDQAVTEAISRGMGESPPS